VQVPNLLSKVEAGAAQRDGRFASSTWRASACMTTIDKLPEQRQNGWQMKLASVVLCGAQRVESEREVGSPNRAKMGTGLSFYRCPERCVTQ
jgi:hypothetical protein